jgi:hypothetical protein
MLYQLSYASSIPPGSKPFGSGGRRDTLTLRMYRGTETKVSTATAGGQTIQVKPFNR